MGQAEMTNGQWQVAWACVAGRRPRKMAGMGNKCSGDKWLKRGESGRERQREVIGEGNDNTCPGERCLVSFVFIFPYFLSSHDRHGNEHSGVMVLGEGCFFVARGVGSRVPNRALLFIFDHGLSRNFPFLAPTPAFNFFSHLFSAASRFGMFARLRLAMSEEAPWSLESEQQVLVVEVVVWR